MKKTIPNKKYSYEKCCHDSCLRKAVIKLQNGQYCKACLQLPTKICQWCSSIISQNKPLKSSQSSQSSKTPPPKNKHNKWINGFYIGKNFFSWIETFGKVLFFIAVLVTMIVYWVDMSARLFDLSVFMLQFIRMSIGFIIFGVLMKYLCDYFMRILYEKELKELKEVGLAKYLNISPPLKSK